MLCCRVLLVTALFTLAAAVADDVSSDVSSQEPPPDLAQDRRPTLRTHMPQYDAPHHDLKAVPSSDYAYTYPGANSYAGVYDHGGHHEHFHVMEDHGHHHDYHHHDDHEDHITSRDIAFGFLTFMIILSNLQSALINISKNNTLVGVITSRRRRDVPPEGPLPFPDDKNWLLVGDRQVRCVQHSACVTTRELARELGPTGRRFGRYLSRLVAKSVDASWARLVADAGQAGVAGVDCEVLYRGCHSHLDPQPSN